MKNKIKIQLPREKNMSSKDVDIILNVDLNRSFNEFKKERFDNNFDLEQQFIKERNESRNFRVYGEINSNIIDCDDIIIKVYSNSGLTNLYSIINTSALGYIQKNVFNKKNGKYYLEANNYPFDELFFLIESDGFTYKDQIWSQRVVFYDAQVNFVNYGTDTIDINDDGVSVVINNNFPFFFNKHWIRKNFNVIEEKQAKISFDQTLIQTQEGDIFDMNVSLDKPSPFGNEKFKIELSNTTSTDFLAGKINSQVEQVLLSSDDLNSIYNGNIFFTISSGNIDYLSEEMSFYILNGEYQGSYFIKKIINGNDSTSRKVILNAQYQPSYDNSFSFNYQAGDIPDINYSIDGQNVFFPLYVQFVEGQQNLAIRTEVVSDTNIELQESFLFSITEREYVAATEKQTCEIVVIDNTKKNKTRINFGGVYQNNVWFTGRTFMNTNSVIVGRTSSPSVLRNGEFFENRNEEFYNNDNFYINVKNIGKKTLFPNNSYFNISGDTIFRRNEIKTFYINTKYAQTVNNTIDIVFSQFAIPVTSLEYFINDCPVYGAVDSTYKEFKKITNKNDDLNFYSLRNIDSPFDAEYFDDEFRVRLTSKNKGTKLSFRTNNISCTANTIFAYSYSEPKDFILDLYANSEDNNSSNYEIEIKKNGYRDLKFIATGLTATETIKEYFSINSYSNILSPYDSQFGVCYYGTGSTNDDQIFGQEYIINLQPSYMPKNKTYMNGILLFSENNLPFRQENVSYSDEYFFSEKNLKIIPCTGTRRNLTATTQTIELTIPKTYVYNNGYRGFKLEYGTDGNQTRLYFGALSAAEGLNIDLSNDADWWWNHFIKTRDENGNILPNMTLKERLDTGTQNSPEGAFNGVIIDNKTLRLSVKNPNTYFSITEIFNFDEDINIIKYQDIVPAGATESINKSNNWLGGFNVNLEFED